MDFFYTSNIPFAEFMQKDVIPFLDNYKKIEYVPIENKGKIYTELFVPQNPTALVVFFHGFCEFCSKFDELTYYFVKAGFAVLKFDHRGHGFSFREIDDFSKVWIDNFDNYVSDAHTVIEKCAIPLVKQSKIPLFLFAHSMGGTIAALFLERFPTIFDAVVLNAPMLEISLKPFPFFLGRIFAKFMRICGYSRSYVVGHRGFDEHVFFLDSEIKGLDSERIKYSFECRKKDKRLQTWGATYAWLDSSLTALKKVLSKKQLQRIVSPILLFQAEADTVVLLGGQNKFIDAVQSATLISCKDGPHELYNTENKFLKKWCTQIFDFFNNHALKH